MVARVGHAVDLEVVDLGRRGGEDRDMAGRDGTGDRGGRADLACGHGEFLRKVFRRSFVPRGTLGHAVGGDPASGGWVARKPIALQRYTYRENASRL